MVNVDNLIREFSELVSIDSLSLHERTMADRLTQKLRACGLEVFEDDAGAQLGGNAGNLIVRIPGNTDAPSFILMAHMDTVTPGLGKKAILKDGVFHSDGTTVLGADNVGALAVVLEVIRILSAAQVPHGDLYVVFTIAEEIILEGAKHLDMSRVKGDCCLVLDCGGPTGHVAVRAPNLISFAAEITGRAAHAGVEPEKGINAIKIAGRAISKIEVGRLDAETTANFGLISGGEAINTVCEKVKVEGEVRSHQPGRSETFIENLTEVFEDEATAVGGSAVVRTTLRMPRLHVGEDDPIRRYVVTGAEQSGVPVTFITTNGGSDGNIMSGRGIPTVVLAFGMTDPHTTRESISVDDMAKCVRLVIETIRARGKASGTS